MRTSIDFPDELLRHLKARAALDGISMRELLITFVERGLLAPEDIELPPGERPVLPSLNLGSPLAIGEADLSNARLSEFADD